MWKQILFLTLTAFCAVSASNSLSVSNLTLQLADRLIESGKNLFISPLSIQSALALTFLGAKGNTFSQLQTSLSLSDDTHEDHKKLLESYKDTSKNYSLNLANNLYVQTDFAVEKKYLDDAKKYYLAPVENLNFATDSAGSAKTINDWVEKNTGNMIKDFFSPTALDKDTALVLVNAIYFQGFWTVPFKSKDTVNSTFRLENGGNKTTEFMIKRAESLNYVNLSDIKASALQLDYIGDDIKMVFLLPNENEKISDVIKRLDSSKLLDISNRFQPAVVNLRLPKFKLETEYSDKLKSALKDIGITDLFTKGASNLTGISVKEKLYASLIQHKAVVEVDELGSKAAAATGIVLIPLSASLPPPNVVEFTLDRPFAFWILDKRTNTILFFGVYYTPT